MERILVCGGRDFGCLPNNFERNPPWEETDNLIQAELKVKSQQRLLVRVLNSAKSKYEIELIIHGAARGADRLAGNWALANGIEVSAKPANWNRDGNKAGPIRNQQMLDEDKPTLVIAFPGGVGTRDMIQRAKKAGIKVVEVPYNG